MTTHLITGLTGQDGTSLARALVAAGDRVIGTTLSRAPALVPDSVEVVWLDITNKAAFAATVTDHAPDVIHNLAGQSSVSQSWVEPELSDAVNRRAVIEMLDVLGDFPDVRFIQASSAEIFGDANGPSASESTPLAPTNPYAEAKAAAHLAVQEARAGGLQASNLVLFGHTGLLQTLNFALPGICVAAAQVAGGDRQQVEVQNPDVRRDWGSATDHVRAFALAAEAAPDDFVIGTGELTALRDVIAWALAAAGAPDAPIVATGSDRPSDHDGLVADFSHALATLGWQPEITLRTEIERMVASLLG